MNLGKGNKSFSVGWNIGGVMTVDIKPTTVELESLTAELRWLAPTHTQEVVQI